MKRQKKTLLPIPDFENEDAEREFWATHSSTEYVDWSKAQEVVFPNLKPSAKSADSGQDTNHAGRKIVSVSFSGNIMTVKKDDGQVISTRWDKYQRLRGSSELVRNNFELIGGDIGIHWPELDEDLSAEGLIRDSQICS